MFDDVCLGTQNSSCKIVYLIRDGANLRKIDFGGSVSFPIA